MDEVTDSDGKVLGGNAYIFTGGKQKGRMSGGSNAERARGEPWALAMITTGNKSIVEAIAAVKAAPLAEARRILEVKLANTKGWTKPRLTVTTWS